MKRVFITGAGGFIGRNIQEQLKHKYHLLTPSRKELDLLNKGQVDLFFKKNKIDVVIHCAIVGGSIKAQEVSTALSENIRIFLNITGNHKRFKKMIQLGSGSEYYNNRQLIDVNEADFGRYIPSDDYSLFKYISSKLIENSNKIVNLRVFGLFGKYDDYHLRFISNSICRNIFGQPIEINQNRVFDYMYIDDFVKIVDYFISHEVKYKFYNIGNGLKIDLISIAHAINTSSHIKSRIIVKKEGIGYEYTCNNLRLMKEIPSLKFTETSEAVKILFNWYKKYKADLTPPW